MTTLFWLLSNCHGGCGGSAGGDAEKFTRQKRTASQYGRSAHQIQIPLSSPINGTAELAVSYLTI